jgi:hypothetical protein
MQVRGDATCFNLLCQHRRPAGCQHGQRCDHQRRRTIAPPGFITRASGPEVQ